MKEVALCTEEMRRERLESFGAVASDVGEGKMVKQSESDSSWAEVSALPGSYIV